MGGGKPFETEDRETPNSNKLKKVNRLGVLRSQAERETAQITR